MMNEIFHTAYQIYRLKSYNRYNNKPRIQNENVLEHISTVTLISMLLSEKFKNVDKHRILQLALIHDIGELFIGEVPKTIKDRFPELKSILEKCEFESLSEFFPNYDFLVREWVEGKSTESKIVKLADKISVLLYSSRESKLGNSLMREIFQKTFDELKLLVSSSDIFSDIQIDNQDAEIFLEINTEE